jgi:hypothetical protein
MNNALVIGNGESRKWFCPSHQIIMTHIVTYGCNAIYREGSHCVNNLIAVDYAMQQEIYDSGWAQEKPNSGDMHSYPVHNAYFANWSIVPASIADVMFMGYDIPEAFIHRSKKRTEDCVIQGKDPITLQEKIETAIKMNPQLDMNDLRLKMEKDIGVWITYVEEDDNVIPIDFPVGWSAGNTALHLACQHGAEEVYILGYDLSSHEDYLNNIYKGTDNYLPATAKGFNPINWMNQMATVFKEFTDVKFYWVDRQTDEKLDFSNVRDLTKDEMCSILHIL